MFHFQLQSSGNRPGYESADEHAQHLKDKPRSHRAPAVRLCIFSHERHCFDSVFINNLYGCGHNTLDGAAGTETPACDEVGGKKHEAQQHASQVRIEVCFAPLSFSNIAHIVFMFYCDQYNHRLTWPAKTKTNLNIRLPNSTRTPGTRAGI